MRQVHAVPEGTSWLAQIYERLETGAGTSADIDKLLDISDTVFEKSFCAFGDGAAMPVSRQSSTSATSTSRLLEQQGCPFDPRDSMLVAPEGSSGMTATADRGEATEIEMVTLTIDDVELSVPKGTLVIRAAELIGVSIPRFCDHPLLDPVGACRQCLVEIEGQRKPMASCTIAVTDGMVVHTQFTSEAADKAQHGVMELLLINHPLDCPVCDKGGECPLQNQAMSNGRVDSRFEDVKRTFPKPINISSQVLLDRERCVLCRALTRSLTRSPGTRSSSCSNAARYSRSVFTPKNRSTLTFQATPCRSARSGH